MQIVTTIKDLKTLISNRETIKSLGLVPTTGYLHGGHGNLIEMSVADNSFTVVTIVPGSSAKTVNPNREYEGNLYQDAEFADKYGADVLFCPTIAELCPEGFCTHVHMTGITEQLIGLSRPEYYMIYCTYMTKLFNIIRPDCAYYGRKDPQQLAVVKKLVRDLNFDIDIIGCDISREADGLAKSSHNVKLTEEERKAALCLSRAIEAGKSQVASGDKNVKSVLSAMKKIINDEPLAVIDYIKALDADTMQAVPEINQGTVVTVAVYIGRIRLTDNFNV